MTNEEIVEEYLDKRYLKDMRIRVPVKEALLYGLAEGKPKWHDLRKNPDDLPKEYEEVLAVYSDTYGAKGLPTDKNHLRYELVQYYFEEEIGEWLWVESGTDVDLHEVIAWCELPKFKE